MIAHRCMVIQSYKATHTRSLTFPLLRGVRGVFTRTCACQSFPYLVLVNTLTPQYLDEYRQQLPGGISLSNIEALELTPATFTFYTSVAVISSSRIEGEQMEVDSYVKHKTQDIEYLPELVLKPNDLYDAYVYARAHQWSLQNFLHSHALVTTHLLPQKWRGVYRQNKCWLWSTTRVGYNLRQRHSPR